MKNKVTGKFVMFLPKILLLYKQNFRQRRQALSGSVRSFKKIIPNGGKIMLNKTNNIKYTGLIISLFIFVSPVLSDENILVNNVLAQEAEIQKFSDTNSDKTTGYFQQNKNIDLVTSIFDKSVQNKDQLTQIVNEDNSIGLVNYKSGNGLDYKAAKNLNVNFPSKFDFDNDGKTDISIFRPDSGTWWILRSSDGGNQVFQFGNSSYKLAPGKFAGNGTGSNLLIPFGATLPGGWDPQPRFFYTLMPNVDPPPAPPMVQVCFPLGNEPRDITAVDDYDGDGKDDRALWCDGVWIIKSSNTNQTINEQFGLPTDKPVSADYDGDGKADLAVFRPSNGEWWIKRSSNNTVQVTKFGLSTDRPVQADYTGDGKVDLAVWRPSNGAWYVLKSEDNSFYAFPFGTIGDIPVPGDYDGDGRTDAAVWRPSNNVWYINRSSGGFNFTQFGATGDIPIPSVYVR
jgi:hypothetical protein